MSTQNQTKKRRVVVTGVGAVTAAGHNMNETWNAIIEGVSTAGPVTRFDASGMPTTIAYEVKNFKLDKDGLLPEELPYLNDAAGFAVNSAKEAWAQARLGEAVFEKSRFAVCYGAGMGSSDFGWFSEIYSENKVNDPSVKFLSKNFPYTITSVLKRMFGAGGGAITAHTACASSGQSLGDAFEMIAHGDADVVMTGGADSMINPFHMAGFCLLGALSKRNGDAKTASRPFDRDRDGFVLGEGACTLIFEEYEHAKARGAKILGEVAGYGVTESAYRITDLHPEGHGPIEAMQMAVDQAGIPASKVAYVNAHGTSTLLNDRIEALAVNRVFGNAPDACVVSSTKSVTGHMISAAGAIEFAVCLKALQHQVIPPSTNLFNVDPSCEINIAPRQPTPKTFEYALSNSVGFGGSNTALVARRI